jgi:hypothetical protein
MTTSGRTPIYGPERWATRHGMVWSYWDLWFCVVALVDHDGDLDALAEAIEEGGRVSGGGTAEAKLSHLDDLKRRMVAAGTGAETLVAGEDTEPKTRAKARTKVLKQGLYPRDMTEPMWHTPRQRLYERALRGRWHLFPVSPEPFYDRLSSGLGEGFRSKGQTFKLARRLEAAIERMDRTTANSVPNRLAARRALVAWCYRAMERCDDSYGVIGEVGTDALLTYASIDYEPAGIAGEDWCEDLCELLAWENWGLPLHAETRPFAQLRSELAEHAERFMLSLADELRTRRLRYEADQTLQNVAYLHIAAGRLTRFASVAARLGSDHWMPIVALAEAAIKRGRNDIAHEVFAAADQPGLPRDYLRQRSIELTGASPSPLQPPTSP